MGGELVKFGGAAGMACAGEVLGGCGCMSEVVVVWVYKWSFEGVRCGMQA